MEKPNADCRESYKVAGIYASQEKVVKRGIEISPPLIIGHPFSLTFEFYLSGKP